VPCSISLVFANKVLLDKRFSIEAPLFMTWFQCLVTVGICWVNGELGRRAAPDSFFKQFPTFSYNLATARKLLPLSIVFVGMMSGPAGGRGWG
jgi:solute carrier family 35 (GDP-fucose transporter), member C1